MGTENLTGFEQIKDGIAHTASLGQQPGYSVMPRVRDAVFLNACLFWRVFLRMALKPAVLEPPVRMNTMSRSI